MVSLVDVRFPGNPIALDEGATVTVSNGLVIIQSAPVKDALGEQQQGTQGALKEGESSEIADDIQTTYTENAPTLKTKSTRRRELRAKGCNRDKQKLAFEYQHSRLEVERV